MCIKILRKFSHLGVELVVTEVQGGVDWFKRLKVNIDFLLLAFLCHNCATIHNQAIGWHWEGKKKARDHEYSKEDWS